jgi:hypothetical protein
MLMTEFENVVHRFQCRNYERLFSTRLHCLCHKRTCVHVTKEKLPGGFFTLTSTIFDRLAEQGITVLETDRFILHFLCFDMEAMLLEDKREVTEPNMDA